MGPVNSHLEEQRCPVTPVSIVSQASPNIIYRDSPSRSRIQTATVIHTFRPFDIQKIHDINLFLCVSISRTRQVIWHIAILYVVCGVKRVKLDRAGLWLWYPSHDTNIPTLCLAAVPCCSQYRTYRNTIGTRHRLEPFGRYKAGRISIVQGAVLVEDILPARILLFRVVQAGADKRSLLGSNPRLSRQAKTQEKGKNFRHGVLER
jgi:hypothetical protein